MRHEKTTKKKRLGLTRNMRLIILLLVVVVSMGVVRLTGIAERIAYMPTREKTPAPFGGEDVTFVTDDGLTLHGWYFKPINMEDDQRTPAVLHLHGNAGNMSYHEGFCRFLTHHGIGVLMFDYRSYGESDTGSLHRRALLRDAEAAYAYLHQRNDVDPDRLGIYGVSLGGAFAVPLAVNHADARALCTLSTFSSWQGVASDRLPVIAHLLMPAGLDAIDQVPHLTHLPWLIVHGDADEIINVRHARKLSDAATAVGIEVSLHIAQGADHNQLLDTHPDAQSAIAAFFARELGTHTPQP